MKNRTNTFLMLLALAFGIFLLANRYVIARPSVADNATRKWEYGHLYAASYDGEDKQWSSGFISLSTPPGRFDEIKSTPDGLGALNKLGAEGWEVVGLIPTQGSQPEYLLKRPKS